MKYVGLVIVIACCFVVNKILGTSDTGALLGVITGASSYVLLHTEK